MKLNEIRKKQVKIIGIGLILIFIVYFVYPTINTFRLKLTSKNIKPTEGVESNIFENITYIGVDASGKQYNVRAKRAVIDKDNQDLISLKEVDSDFLLKDGGVIKIISKAGLFNKTTNDILYEQNVKITQKDGVVIANRAEYLVKSNNIFVSGNVIADLVEIDSKTKKRRTSQIKADKVIIDTFKKTVEVVMEEKGKQVTGILSNER
ncbi:MAG: LPS export ABC transporter periplasmic protein LptC [Pseudomonadota bacterium]